MFNCKKKAKKYGVQTNLWKKKILKTFLRPITPDILLFKVLKVAFYLQDLFFRLSRYPDLYYNKNRWETIKMFKWRSRTAATSQKLNITCRDRAFSRSAFTVREAKPFMWWWHICILTQCQSNVYLTIKLETITSKDLSTCLLSMYLYLL